MSWKKACCIYCVALAVAALVNIEKVSVWTDEHLAQTPLAPLTREIRQVRNDWRDSSAGRFSKRTDCALAPYFNGTYKNTLACQETPEQNAAEKALRRRMDPALPVLKPDAPVDTNALLAALSAPPMGGKPGLTAAGLHPRPGETTSPATGEQTSLVAQKAPTPHKILVVGDSLAIGLSLSLRRSVAALDGVELIGEGKVSSGLANPKYYNWGRALRIFLDKYSPDLVVVMMGANDARYINPDEKPRPPGSTNKSWPEVFSMRMGDFLAALTEKHIPSYWIGLPIMGNPSYAKQAQVMNAIIRAECAKAKNSRYLDTWTLLADAQGNYSTFLPNAKGVKIKVRANDKIHFTVAGGDILARSFLTTLAKDVVLRPKTSHKPAGRANASTTAAARK